MIVERKLRILDCLMLMILVGCEAPSEVAIPAPAIAPDLSTAALERPDLIGFDQIKLFRDACLGECPVYALTINRDGSVAYDGINFVKVKGAQTAQLSQKDLTMLVESLKWANFGALKSLDQCPELATDGARTRITLTLNGAATDIYVNSFCEHTDSFLRFVWLSDTLDILAQTQRWIRDQPRGF